MFALDYFLGVYSPILLAIVMLSTTIYVLSLLTIARYHVLRHKPFFMLIMALGCMDLGSMWFSFLFQRLLSNRVIASFYLSFGNHGVLPFMCTNAVMLFHSAQKFLLVAIALNRFSSMLPGPHGIQMWTRTLCRFYIFVIIGTHVVMGVAFETVGRSFFDLADDKSNILQCRRENYGLQNSATLYSTFLSIAAAAVSCALYIASAFRFIRNRNIVKSIARRDQAIRKTEQELTICAFVQSLFLILHGASSVVAFAVPIPTFIYINDCTQDLLSLTNAYVLPLFSPQLSNRIRYIINESRKIIMKERSENEGHSVAYTSASSLR
ncbi:hypothetical protein QR680_007214 [Steinernema hermaphroditum]|uniref:Serpentine receptor class gamma n=1 Tax=Steinernema hermaphroditum TaxID=289476 RepID=A0AA39HZ98_9BILA|nr:hypothetical protein QR680_007214 [Steinernema hermaphroditum]